MGELVIPTDIKFGISKVFLDVANQIKELSVRPGAVFKLAKEPTKNELRFCIKGFGFEIGIAHLNDSKNWRMVKGATTIIPFPKELEDEADILAHTHLGNYSYLGNLSNLPAPEDTILATISKKKEFIIHINGVIYSTGVTRHPVTGEKWIPRDLKELEYVYWSFFGQNRFLLNRDTEGHVVYDQRYKEVILESLGVTVIQKDWRELPSRNPLSKFPMSAV